MLSGVLTGVLTGVLAAEVPSGEPPTAAASLHLDSDEPVRASAANETTHKTHLETGSC